MAAASPGTVPRLLSIEKYLNTTYRPDVDFVDGRIERRNLGKFDHADLQFEIALLLRSKQKEGRFGSWARTVCEYRGLESVSPMYA